MIRPLLGLCARDTATAGMLAVLGRRLAAWQADPMAWEALVDTAEGGLARSSTNTSLPSGLFRRTPRAANCRP